MPTQVLVALSPKVEDVQREVHRWVFSSAHSPVGHPLGEVTHFFVKVFPKVVVAQINTHLLVGLLSCPK